MCWLVKKIFGVLLYYFLSKVLKNYSWHHQTIPTQPSKAFLTCLKSYQVATAPSFMYLLSHHSKEYFFYQCLLLCEVPEKSRQRDPNPPVHWGRTGCAMMAFLWSLCHQLSPQVSEGIGEIITFLCPALFHSNWQIYWTCLLEEFPRTCAD